MDREDELKERLNCLIEQGLLSVEVLQEATGIEQKVLRLFLSGEDVELSNDDMEHSQRKLRLHGISDCLIEGMKVSDDDRVKGVLDVLIQVYRMNYKMVAGYAGMEEREVIDFMNGSKQISCDKKYKLAVKVFSLVQAMKNV